MISDSGFDSGSSPELNPEEPPMSRTHQYRKVMKPLLERKRRARINKCLDDLKDLMVSALKSEGESITKLEKADVLELTVKYLRKLKRQNALGLTPSATYAAKFKVGYVHCAQDVSRFMSTIQQHQQTAIDMHVSTRLLSHLANCCQALESMPPSVVSMAMSPPPPPGPAVVPPVPHPGQALPALQPLLAPSALSASSYMPVSAFSPVHSVERHVPIKEEPMIETKIDLRGKENQAMDLSKATGVQLPLSALTSNGNEKFTRNKEDPSWRPW